MTSELCACDMFQSKQQSSSRWWDNPYDQVVRDLTNFNCTDLSLFIKRGKHTGIIGHELWLENANTNVSLDKVWMTMTKLVHSLSPNAAIDFEVSYYPINSIMHKAKLELVVCEWKLAADSTSCRFAALWCDDEKEMNENLNCQQAQQRCDEPPHANKNKKRELAKKSRNMMELNL